MIAIGLFRHLRHVKPSSVPAQLTAAWIKDPLISLLEAVYVPAKNRVHLDVRVAGLEVRGEERERRIEEQIARLIGAGASIAWRENDIRGSSVVMRDPEVG